MSKGKRQTQPIVRRKHKGPSILRPLQGPPSETRGNAKAPPGECAKAPVSGSLKPTVFSPSESTAASSSQPTEHVSPSLGVGVRAPFSSAVLALGDGAWAPKIVHKRLSTLRDATWRPATSSSGSLMELPIIWPLEIILLGVTGNKTVTGNKYGFGPPPLSTGPLYIHFFGRCVLTHRFSASVGVLLSTPWPSYGLNIIFARPPPDRGRAAFVLLMFVFLKLKLKLMFERRRKDLLVLPCCKQSIRNDGDRSTVSIRPLLIFLIIFHLFLPPSSSSSSSSSSRSLASLIRLCRR